MNIDYLIIGQGIAGTVLAFSLLQKGKKILIIDAGNQYGSSVVAAGIVNPITGRRLVKTWEADTILPIAKQLYTHLEKKLSTSFYHDRTIVRIFENVQQENDFYSKSADSNYEQYLSDESISIGPCFNNENGCGFVKGAAQLMTKTFLKTSRAYFIKNNLLRETTFKPDYKELANDSGIILGKEEIRFKRTVFCEGFQVKGNTLFNYLPFTPSKGVFALVNIDFYKADLLIKKGLMIAPTETDNLYWAGATYNHQDLSSDITEKEKQYINDKLKKLMVKDALFGGYKVVDYGVGIRPTTKDRRPIVGKHSDFPNMVLFNGMGSKGVSLAPWLADELIHHLEENKPLSVEVDLNRFEMNNIE